MNNKSIYPIKMSEVHELKAENEKLKAQIKKMNDLLGDIFASQDGGYDVDGPCNLIYHTDEEQAQYAYEALKKLEDIWNWNYSREESARKRPKVESSSAVLTLAAALGGAAALIENNECECAQCLPYVNTNEFKGLVTVESIARSLSLYM